LQELVEIQTRFWRMFTLCSIIIFMMINKIVGRGALSNQTGRFEPVAREAQSDGWDIPEEQKVLRTTVRVERPRSVISYNKSPDLPFDRSIVRSIPIAGANMAVSIVLPAPHMPIWACLPVWILRQS
jgi:hypothetical protein